GRGAAPGRGGPGGGGRERGGRPAQEPPPREAGDTSRRGEPDEAAGVPGTGSGDHRSPLLAAAPARLAPVRDVRDVHACDRWRSYYHRLPGARSARPPCGSPPAAARPPTAPSESTR